MDSARQMEINARFVAELTTAFAAQHQGRPPRGAQVEGVELVCSRGDDFGVRITFRRLPAGPVQADTIADVRVYMDGCNANTAAELAAFWQQELDELVLAED